jgi:single-stranded-DNA-specific exonuclease
MEPIIDRIWVDRCETASLAGIDLLSKKLNISAVTARLLLLRGVDTPESAEDFLNGKLSLLPDPYTMLGMDKSVERLLKAVQTGEKISIHGDYDVDGISATTLLVEFFRSIGVAVDYHIPLRMKDGYGLSAEAIESAAAAGATVVISVDCGVSAHKEAILAAEKGLDLIVTDHHQPPDPLPTAFAIINPHQIGCTFSYKNLSGVGVAFFLLVALRARLRKESFFTSDNPEPDLRYALDLVALGTIADVVPLDGLNRLLTQIGLQVMTGGRRIGLSALQRVAKVDTIDCAAVGFKLAPRLNAAGRIEDAALGVKLLLLDDVSSADDIAEQLDCFNLERQAIEQKTLQAALGQVAELPDDRRSIVLGSDLWHSGVIGIVASRLVERFYRPTVLFAFDGEVGKGSARSTKESHLYRNLQSCADLLLGFGGHAAAAGMTINEAGLDLFRQRFEETVIAEQSEQIMPMVAFDGDLLLEEVDDNLIQELARLAPFGMGNPGPVFCLRDSSVMGVQLVGEKHLRFSIRQGGYSLPCIAFGMAERQEELSGQVDFLVTPGFNIWKGRRTIQLRIRDWKKSVPAA